MLELVHRDGARFESMLVDVVALLGAGSLPVAGKVVAVFVAEFDLDVLGVRVDEAETIEGQVRVTLGGDQARASLEQEWIEETVSELVGRPLITSETDGDRQHVRLGVLGHRAFDGSVGDQGSRHKRAVVGVTESHNKLGAAIVADGALEVLSTDDHSLVVRAFHGTKVRLNRGELRCVHISVAHGTSRWLDGLPVFAVE